MFYLFCEKCRASAPRKLVCAAKKCLLRSAAATLMEAEAAEAAAC